MLFPNLFGGLDRLCMEYDQFGVSSTLLLKHVGTDIC